MPVKTYNFKLKIMFCLHCGNENSLGSKYCGDCGKQIVVNKDVLDSDISSDRSSSVCEVCKQNKPVIYTDFYENVGLLIMRLHKNVKGLLCFDCQKDIFWKFTIKTLVLGWWGIISFIVTPFILLNNIIRYSINYLKFKKSHHVL